MEEVNLNVIRMIQIAKDIKTNEMAEAFGVTPSAISAVKKGIRDFSFQTLKYGLKNLGISLNDYGELDDFKVFLENEELDKYSKYGCMLAKTLGVLCPEQRELAEAVVAAYLNKEQTRGK